MIGDDVAMTDAELTILSLVAEGSRFGYEIQDIIDDRGLRDWLSVGFSSVYYILNRLETQKLLTSRLHTDGHGPARKIYELTDAGRGVLQTAISDLLRQPRALGAGFELGLANIHVLKPHQVYKVLVDHRDDLKLRLQAVEENWRQHQTNDEEVVLDHIHALYTHSIALMRSELEWLNQFIGHWVEKYPAAKDATEPKRPQFPPDDAQAAATRLHRRTTPEPAKMIQTLKRPRPPQEE
jgi:DNA-binding PadR family transcriptional regulator